MTYLYEFKAAVHLNNTGVSLLQRRCYRQAMKTLSDALSIMKAVSSRLDASSTEAPTLQGKEFSTDIQGKLRDAAQRLASPRPSTAEMCKNISVQVLSDDSSPTAVEPSLLGEACDTGSPCSQVIYLIQMEPADFEVPNEKDAAYESSTILYNYGMAYRCLSSLSTSIPFTPKLDNGAFQMFYLAYSTLLTHHGMDQRLMSAQFSRIILTALLSLHHLVDLAHQFGRESDRHGYFIRLRDLQNSIRRLGVMDGKEQAARAA
jgi:hypothetical protein